MGTKDYFSRKRVILEYPDCTSEYIVYIDQVNLFHWHVTYAWGLQDIEINWICPPPQMEKVSNLSIANGEIYDDDETRCPHRETIWLEPQIKY